MVWLGLAFAFLFCYLLSALGRALTDTILFSSARDMLPQLLLLLCTSRLGYDCCLRVDVTCSGKIVGDRASHLPRGLRSAHHTQSLHWVYPYHRHCVAALDGFARLRAEYFVKRHSRKRQAIASRAAGLLPARVFFLSKRLCLLTPCR